ncbi:hypothetical protein RM405_004121 [Enterobacter kobei]|uniref:hypothetical protein n=1 Tax=Enterobacter cloacae complex TaxID=354276 RepID=UPI001F2053D3|nr:MULTISPECIES: hypothetical protein [Enterobacter cloacae complex]ELE9693044.1 hypothetical protein [Enterobacter kobei]ELN9397947.1 hypothetical protein [Enterobacter kobei]MCF1189697.1 hypothetical protein [Enterobacter hormaechei]WNI98516.1 hypothetical protein RIK67_00245 [Enterobacter ludwigii]WNJ07391.1 hypothetical protein RIK62_23255 [Enterobacter ludwigii]
MNKKFISVVLAILLAIIALLLIFVFYFLDATIASSLKWSVGAVIIFVISLTIKSISQIAKLQNFLLNNPIGVFLKKNYEEAEELNRKIAMAGVKIALRFLIMIGYITEGKNNKEKEKQRAKSRQKTVVDLYLLNEKKKLLKGKLAGLFMVAISLAYIGYSNSSIWFIAPGVIVFFVNSMKEEVLTYRVRKGFFGRNVDEALQLIKFIHENIDDINNDGNGESRRILNNKEQKVKEFVMGWNGEQSA